MAIYSLVDTKAGTLNTFAELCDAQAALRAWIDRQRGAREPVVMVAPGVWSDSKIRTWIADESGKIVAG